MKSKCAYCDKETVENFEAGRGGFVVCVACLKSFIKQPKESR